MARMATTDSQFEANPDWLLALSIAIKSQRQLLKLTQERLAHKSDIHWRYLQEIEAGHHNGKPKNISVGMLIALAKGLDMTPTKLMKIIEAYYNSEYIK